MDNISVTVLRNGLATIATQDAGASQLFTDVSLDGVLGRDMLAKAMCEQEVYCMSLSSDAVYQLVFNSSIVNACMFQASSQVCLSVDSSHSHRQLHCYS